jgi:CRISPR-associated protein Cas1
MILIVDRRACTLRHDAGVLVVQGEGRDTQRAPVAQLEQVVVYGNPLAETAVWRALANAGVPTVLLPSRGPDGAAMLANGLATAFPLRHLQHCLAADPERARALAAWAVRHKLLGYDLPLRLLQQRHGADSATCSDFVARRDLALAALERATSDDVLLGIEGQVANAWFALLAATLAPAWDFKGRNRRPPRDPVNALLSLGYTLLGSEVHQGAMASGLDPSLGFLHQPAPGRESMVLDIVEIFRGGVDHFVLNWIAPDGPSQADFYYRSDTGCRLSKAARPRFFGAWATYRASWPHPLAPEAGAEWASGGLREQIHGWIERLRAEMKRLEGAAVAKAAS